MIFKSKSCPSILFTFTLKAPPSYGTFLRMFPNATKAHRYRAITNFYKHIYN